MATSPVNFDSTVGGKSVDLFKEPFARRRAVYGFIDRQNLPGVFRTFDFASPDTHSPCRFFTTVPQQALFMLNSPLIERATRQLMARKDVAADPESTARITRLYQTIFGRSPSPDDQARAKQCGARLEELYDEFRTARAGNVDREFVIQQAKLEGTRG